MCEVLFELFFCYCVVVVFDDYGFVVVMMDVW